MRVTLIYIGTMMMPVAKLQLIRLRAWVYVYVADRTNEQNEKRTTMLYLHISLTLHYVIP